MTIGSGNGWPDVIQVPKTKTYHDTLCPAETHGLNCSCDLIKRVRQSERQRIAKIIESEPWAGDPKSYIVARNWAVQIAKSGGSNETR